MLYMSSLAARLSAIARRDVASSSSTPLLPRSLVDDMIEASVVRRALGVPSDLVYETMLEMLAVVEAPDKQEDSPFAARRCEACASSEWWCDARGGDWVCRACGACAARLLKPPELPPSSSEAGEGTCCSRSRPSKRQFVASSCAVWDDGRTPAERAVEVDVEHWGELVSVVGETLERAKRLVVRHRRRHCGSSRRANAAIVAALLVTGLPEAFVDERSVRAQRPLALLAPATAPPPRFTCQRCAARVYSHKEARLHCLSGGGPRRR